MKLDLSARSGVNPLIRQSTHFVDVLMKQIMRKIVILLGIILFMIACEKGNEEVREAKVVIVVYDENGKIATGIPVKMYNEKDYKVFEKDNLTLPTAVARTNESGIATFILPQEEWFAAQSQRFFTFVVQEGGGPDNYQIWSSGRTVEAGKVVKIEIRLTQFPS